MSSLETESVQVVLQQIRQLARPARLMEVCGTHTAAIFAAGIRSLLPPQVELVSGPGCPVCVTPNAFIDTAIAWARLPDVIIASFGDMLKVPGTASSLAKAKMAGAAVRVVYSPLQAVELAAAQPQKQVVFLAVGFETTAPATAAAVLMAETRKLKNFLVFSAHKLMPPALASLLALSGANLDGLLLPGHVCMVTGPEQFAFLPAKHRLPAVVAGFEPPEILQAIYLLLKQLADNTAKLENAYPAAVRPGGNQTALAVMAEVFEPSDAVWRGLGLIRASGLRLRAKYRRFAAETSLPPVAADAGEMPGCRCGEVLCGLLTPPDCPLFGKACSPAQPAGACMVSAEGTCAAWFKYPQGRCLM